MWLSLPATQDWQNCFSLKEQTLRPETLTTRNPWICAPVWKKRKNKRLKPFSTAILSSKPTTNALGLQPSSSITGRSCWPWCCFVCFTMTKSRASTWKKITWARWAHLTMWCSEPVAKVDLVFTFYRPSIEILQTVLILVI
uniref:(northern house mosquito) hypothetical protein n=1 Tax=Culex pipiens TaxID=7175 RepID=A0A8D8HFQ3_CULPI